MVYNTTNQNCLQDGTSKVPEAAGARWRFCGRISSDVFGLSSNRLSLGRSIQGVSAVWWGWRVTLMAPRIGNEASYVTQIIADILLVWQAQYLVRLEGGFTCSTHWKWGFTCDADDWWHSFCVAGAVFGEVGGWLYLLHALGMRLHMWRRSLITFILRGRRSIWWGWRVTWLDPGIGNDVLYVTQIIDEVHFPWQAQYLLSLKGAMRMNDDIHFAWQAQYSVKLGGSTGR